MDPRRIYGTNALVLGLVLTGAQLARAEEEKSDPLIGRIEFKLGLGGARAHILSIPDGMRSVQAYHQTTSYLLPAKTEGEFGGFILGGGVAFRNMKWWGINLDLASADSFLRGRDTWSEIGFPSDDYIGYRYHGLNVDLSTKLIPIWHVLAHSDLENLQLYVRAGLRTRITWLESGTDAWNTFDEHHEMSLFGESLLFGFGLRLYMLELEYRVARPWLGESVAEEWKILSIAGGINKESGCGGLLSFFCE